MVLAPKIATYSALEQVAIFAFPAWISSVILATHAFANIFHGSGSLASKQERYLRTSRYPTVSCSFYARYSLAMYL
jgi:hypothetical protein